MASTAISPYPNEAFGLVYEDPIDIFDQFLTFNNTDDEGFLDISTHENHSESWASPQQVDSSQHKPDHGFHFYSEASGRAAISDTELINFEDMSFLSPVLPAKSHSLSLPPSPTIALTTSSRKKSYSKSASILRSPIRKAMPSSKIARRSHTAHKIRHDWETQLDRVLSGSETDLQCNLRLRPLSPPPSARVSDASENNKARREQYANSPFTNAASFPAIDPQLIEYSTPIGTPGLDESVSPLMPYPQASLGSMLTPITPQNRQPSNLWSQLPGSGTSRYTYKPIPELDSPIWWSHAASAPLAQPSPNTFHRNPQLATESLAHQLQNDLVHESKDIIEAPTNMPNGLMIFMAGSSPQHSYTLESSALIPYNDSDFSPPPSQAYNNPQTYAISPTIPKQERYSSPSSRPHNSTVTRRKTRANSSIPSSPSPKTSSPPSAANCHAKKQRRTSKKNLSPQIGGAGGAFDFVNYTPSDSNKLLSGVAPSGSSRTKARREKEAREKRRISEAALLRAVIDAGGDVDSLVEQGIFT